MYLTTEEVKKAVDGRPEGITPQQVVEGLVARGHQLQGFNAPAQRDEGTEVGASISQRISQDKIRTGGFMESALEQAKPGIQELGKQYREGKISGLSAGLQTGIRMAAAPISRAFGEVAKAPFTALAGLSPQNLGQDYGAISQDAGRALEEITAPVVKPTIGKAASYVQENYPVASSYAGTALSALDIAGAASPLAGIARGAVGAAGREAVTEAVETAVKPSFNPKTFKALNPTVNTLSRRRNFSLLKEKAALADDTVAELAAKGVVEVPVDTATRAASHAKAMDHVWKNEVQPLIDAGKIADVQVDLNRVADSLESMATEGRKTAAFGAPTLVREFDTVQEIADSLRKKGSMSMDEAEKLKQLYNSQVKNWGGAQVAETLQNAYKTATKEIGEQMDAKLSVLTDSSIKEAKRKWGALRETYEDALKADIVNQRRKGLPIEEAYGRITGIAELLGGAASVLTRGAPAIGEMVSGAGKLVLGKYMASLKDADELVRNGFKEIMQKKVPKDLFGRVKKPVAPVDTPKDIFAKAQQIAQDKKNAEAAKMAIAEAEMKAKATQPAKEVETPVLAQAKGQETNLQSAKESGSVLDTEIPSADQVILPYTNPFSDASGKLATDIKDYTGLIKKPSNLFKDGSPENKFLKSLEKRFNEPEIEMVAGFENGKGAGFASGKIKIGPKTTAQEFLHEYCHNLEAILDDASFKEMQAAWKDYLKRGHTDYASVHPAEWFAEHGARVLMDEMKAGSGMLGRAMLAIKKAFKSLIDRDYKEVSRLLNKAEENSKYGAYQYQYGLDRQQGLLSDLGYHKQDVINGKIADVEFRMPDRKSALKNRADITGKFDFIVSEKGKTMNASDIISGKYPNSKAAKELDAYRGLLSYKKTLEEKLAKNIDFAKNYDELSKVKKEMEKLRIDSPFISKIKK